MIRNVVLIAIDTLRQDHLGCYGYRRTTSPTIDELARKGVIFLRAYASDVPTIPSFTSLFTGRRGIKTGIVSHRRDEVLSDEIFWLPEYLAKQGIKTAAVSTLYFMRKWFSRGFNYYMNPVAGDRRRTQQVDAEEINYYAIRWLKQHKDERFFLFIHYWDPHMFYKPPSPYSELFYSGNPCDPNNHSLDKLKQCIDWPFRKRQLDEILPGVTDLEFIIAQYDGEIRYVDDKIKEVIELLEKLRLLEETLVVICSDHGESLGEHNVYFDHADVYEPVIHIPLILFGSEIPSGKKVKALVQSIDITPTILDYLGLPLPNDLDGRSLRPLIEGEINSIRNVVYCNQATWTAKRTMIKGFWKLIKTYDETFWKVPRIELYDLKDDPNETKNLVERRKDLVDSMELEMTRWLEENLKGSIDPVKLVVSRGIPALSWVERAYKSMGMLDKWNEWLIRRKASCIEE